MSPPEHLFAVLLHGRKVGCLWQRGDHTLFRLSAEYLAEADRPVLGLRFEEDTAASHSAALRLPRWFSNLLPEGAMREWIAEDRGVSVRREMELLAQVGHDLPGAVQVLLDVPGTDPGELPSGVRRNRQGKGAEPAPSPWRFSLAGVALKFSMLARGDRLTVPAIGENGDWLVKFPDQRFEQVPRNEFVMMSMARDIGAEVPEIRLVHRDELIGLPDRMWPNREVWAYAIRRFDRGDDPARTPVHMEDFAQIRDKYPEAKYEGTFETVAALAYRGHDLAALREMVRRLAFSLLIGNGDAHLKNWSLIYRDRRNPTLSPAYDLVSTTSYDHLGGQVDDLGLRFDRTRRFEQIRISSFGRLEERLDGRFGTTGADLQAVVTEVRQGLPAAWERHRATLDASPELAAGIEEWMVRMVARLGAR